MKITAAIAKEFVELDNKLNKRLLNYPNTTEKKFLEWGREAKKAIDGDEERFNQLWKIIRDARTLDDDAAPFLGEYKGHQLYIGWNSGYGCEISPKAYEGIAKGNYWLNLHLKKGSFTVDAARGLAKHKGGVTFLNLWKLEPDIAKALSEYQGHAISFLTPLPASPEAVRELNKFKGQVSGVIDENKQ